MRNGTGRQFGGILVVYDALKRELFVAARIRGARLNGRPIHVSATHSLDRALLTTAFL